MLPMRFARVVAVLLSIGAAHSSDQHVLKSPIRSTDLESLHRNLTNIESTSGNEKAALSWLASWLQDQGYSIQLQRVEAERHNILAWPGSQRNAHTLVTSHIDTVPPFYPYESKHNGTHTILSGRGSVDAKAAVAGQIIAVNRLLNQQRIDADNVALLFVVGEEVGGDGMQKANELGLTPQVVIFGEPTEGKLVAGHKGIMVFHIETYGRAAHSGYPWLGRSANEVLIEVLTAIKRVEDDLPKSEKYGSTTINIGKISGGQAGNVVAERARADLTARLATGGPDDFRDAVQKAIHEVVKRYGIEDSEDLVRVVYETQGYGPVDLDHEVPGFKSMTVNYGTDVPNLKRTVDGQKRYLYGGGSIFVAHSDHEAMTMDELRDAVDGYERLILNSLD